MNQPWPARTICLLALLFAPAAVAAGEERLVATSARTPVAPTIDGRLDDAVWRRATPISGFVQAYPQSGGAPRFSTEVRILHDDGALYLAARCRDDAPEAIVARVTRRDEEIESDWLRVEIDSRLDRRSGYFFQVNAAGVMLDGTLYDERNASIDWNGVWESRTAVTADGWTAEMRIPLKLLRFNPAARVTFGLLISRRVSRFNEIDRWPLIQPESGLWVSRFGNLEGLDLPERPLSVDLSPYFVVRHDAGEQAASSVRVLDLGLDAKLGLGGNFMLTVAANPDFGQVEADPAELNLSTIETFFPEKRPFFLEDMAIFQLPATGGGAGASLFYTRRIGSAPRTPDLADEESLIHQPALPMIYGAAKLAGKRDRFSLGLLQAVTSRETVLLADGAGLRSRRLAEPLTSYSVLRLKQDFWDHSTAGLMATAMATPHDGVATSGGTDLRMELFSSDYHLTMTTLFSHLTPGRFDWQDSFTQAGLKQRGPVGYGGDVALSKDGGDHLVASVGAKYRSPSLALNDLGYQQRPDQLLTWIWLQHRRLEPLGPIARYYLDFSAWMHRNSDLLNIGDGFSTSLWFEFKNAWSAGIWFNSDLPRCDDRETRSAGRVIVCYEKPWLGGGGWFGSDRSKPFSAAVDVFGHNNERGWGAYVALSLRLEPHERVQLWLVPGYRKGTGLLNWIDTLAEAGGDRYVFAVRQTEYWDVILRGSLTLTRDLSLQLYSQVFMASVDNRRKLAQVPEGRRIVARRLPDAPDVGDDYDYTGFSWNLNAVVRWEFQPGSVAYLVYSAKIGDELEVAEFRFGRLLDDVFVAAGAHVLMLKVSYFWG